MSRYALAILLAIYTCVVWGTITPALAKMSQDLGARYNPLTPLVWNVLGNVVLLAIALPLTNFSPIKNMHWHWTTFLVLLWSTGGISIIYAVSLAAGRESVPNVIAAAYPALVSAPLLWYFLAEPMPLQKLLGILLTLAGVALVILA